ALIRCKVCGKQISDRARVCPHCGARGKVTLRKKMSVDEESAQTVSPSQSATPPNGVQPAKPSDLYTPPLETQSKTPMVIAIVLMITLLWVGVIFFFLLNPKSHRSTTEDYADTVAAQSSEDYSWGSEGQNEQRADEGQAGAESDGSRAIDVFNAQPRNDSSSVSVDRTYSQPEDPGFSKPYDVRQFVADERYEHDDVTLEITSDGIYANGNKISTSTPVFQKLNRKYGRITAKPSISITVSYEDNALIDNSTHERYTHVY
ncbi:MAG: zinc ribbon domain-containing protein, partial [Prevotellaceae bacterium]|nr:zinc ribbon domain-containing protein [Prevotellaceae bacterium]